MTRGTAGTPGGAGRPRPALHFAPQRNWMNDPNGLIQWRGRIHLFYQHNPGGMTLEHIAWGHASSTDLWNWADHPLALEPGPFGPDRDGCWSGCAVVHDGTPHLLYTGLRGPVTLPCLAAASDQDLIRWSRYERNPVIAGPPPEPGVRAFRDHAAWQAGSAWYQVIGGGLADRGGALFRHARQTIGTAGILAELPDVTGYQDGSDPKGPGRRPTLTDVARDARVSKTTASLVLRGADPRNIPAPTQERVRAAARQLGYVRNQAATELRSQAESTIGFIADGVAEGPFGGEMIRGAQDAAWHRGYLLMIVETGHDRDLVCEAVTRFTERRARRIIYASYAHRQVDLPPTLADADPVLANAFDAERKFPSFVPDEFGGGLLAAQTLLAIRRAPVGFINIGRGDPAAVGRLCGYRAGLEGADLPFDESLVIYTGEAVNRIPGKGGGNAVDGTRPHAPSSAATQASTCSSAPPTGWPWAPTTISKRPGDGSRTTWQSSASTTNG